MIPNGKQIDICESTQEEIKLLLGAKKKPSPFYWIQSLKQNSGRGRMGRSWQSEAGNLYLSIYVPESIVQFDYAPATWLPIRVALTAVSTMSFLGVTSAEIKIKWPNDIVVIPKNSKTNFDFKKMGGIIVEHTQSGYVVGIGINLNQHPEVDQPTIALNDILKPECSLDRLRNELVSAVQVELSSPTQTQKLKNRLKNVEVFPAGSHIQWGQGTSQGQGSIVGYGEHGELLIKNSKGESQSLFSEDITGLRSV